jgi:hypothetical protein
MDKSTAALTIRRYAADLAHGGEAFQAILTRFLEDPDSDIPQAKVLQFGIRGIYSLADALDSALCDYLYAAEPEPAEEPAPAPVAVAPEPGAKKKGRPKKQEA